jgi:hypothetical protein
MSCFGFGAINGGDAVLVCVTARFVLNATFRSRRIIQAICTRKLRAACSMHSLLVQMAPSLKLMLWLQMWDRLLQRRRSPVLITLTHTPQSSNSVTTHEPRFMLDALVLDHRRVCGRVELLPLNERYLLGGSSRHYRRRTAMPRGVRFNVSPTSLQ